MKMSILSLTLLISMLAVPAYSMQQEPEDNREVKLVSGDGEKMRIKREVAIVSGLLSDMLEEQDEDEEEGVPTISVPSVASTELARMIDLMSKELFLKRRGIDKQGIREGLVKLINKMELYEGESRLMMLGRLFRAADNLNCNNIAYAVVYCLMDTDPLLFANQKLLSLSMEEVNTLLRNVTMTEEGRVLKEQLLRIMEFFGGVKRRGEELLWPKAFYGALMHLIRNSLDERMPHIVRANAHRKGFSAWFDTHKNNPQAVERITRIIWEIALKALEEDRTNQLFEMTEEPGLLRTALAILLNRKWFDRMLERDFITFDLRSQHPIHGEQRLFDFILDTGLDRDEVFNSILYLLPYYIEEVAHLPSADLYMTRRDLFIGARMNLALLSDGPVIFPEALVLHPYYQATPIGILDIHPGIVDLPDQLDNLNVRNLRVRLLPGATAQAGSVLNALEHRGVLVSRQ